MHIPRLFQAFDPGSKELVLSPEAAHHVQIVMRMKAGDALILFNGAGGEYAATIKAIAKKQVILALGDFHDVDRESALNIHLGQVISKPDRMDFAIQKSVELGVHAITPIIGDFTSVKLSNEHREKRERRWQQMIVNACEQSGRTAVPSLHPICSVDNWSRDVEAELKLIFHPGVEQNFQSLNFKMSHDKTSTQTLESRPKRIAVLIGPEGGLSEREVVQSQQHGFTPIHCGPRLLRTETAATVAMSLLQARWGDV